VWVKVMSVEQQLINLNSDGEERRRKIVCVFVCVCVFVWCGLR